MKKLLLSITMFFLMFAVSAQTAQSTEVKKEKISFYSGAIFAIADGDNGIQNLVSPMIANGLCWKNVAVELDLGRLKAKGINLGN